MGRRFNLLQESNAILMACKFGAFSTRRQRNKIIHGVINDLVHLGIAPISMRAINDEHITSLVTHWQKKNIATRTMRNKLGALRAFFTLAQSRYVVANNKNFGIANVVKQKSYDISDVSKHLSMIETSINKSIVEFQLYFGLTKTESIRIGIATATNIQGRLCVYKNIATNNKDRAVPIVCEAQQQILNNRQKLLGSNRTLTLLMKEKNLLAFYREELLLHGLDPNFPYRRIYAKKRFAVLEKTVARKIAFTTLQFELGIHSKQQLKVML